MAIPPEPPTTPITPGPDPRATDTTKWWWIIGGIFVGALVIGGLVVLLTSGNGDDNVTIPTNPSTSSSSTSTSAPTTTTTTAPVAGQPTIGQFTAAPSPVTCSGANASLTLQWSTQNATGVTVETDGVPQTNPPYPPTGSTALLFNCATTQHNYQLVATAADTKQARQQLTVQGVVPPTIPPTAPPTKPPVTTTTKPPPTTSSSAPSTTTTTTNPVTIPVLVTIDDQHNKTGPMTLVADPITSASGSIEFTVTNAGGRNHSFSVLETDLAYNQLPVNPDTNKVIIGGPGDPVHRIGKIGKVTPGKTKRLKVTLAPGNYVLIDNLPGNYALGARAAFVVTVASPGG